MKRRTNARATDKELYDLRAAGHSCREIAARYTPPLSANSVRARANRYKARVAAAAALKPQPVAVPVPDVEIDALLADVPALLSFGRADAGDDADRWRDVLADLRCKQFVTVAHVSDMHFPFADADALALTYQALELIAPDVIVTLSDGFDFAQISHFAPDPELGNDDILDNVRKHWWDHVDGLHRAAPKATIRAIMGNHDTRLLRFLNETAPQIRRTMISSFDELVRYQKRVLLPNHDEQARIGPLTVMHGNKRTLQKFGAKAQLEETAYQQFVMSGHRHRPDWHLMRGARQAVQSVIGGCLCKLPPHYDKSGAPSLWTQGFAYAIVDMRANYAWLHNVVYERHDGLLRTTIGARILLQEIDADALRMAGD